MAEGTQSPRISVANAIIIVIAVVPFVALYVFLATQFNVMTYAFAGFMFIFYWTAIKQAAPAEFLPSLVGSLGGLLTAFLVTALPAVLGTAGLIIVALLIGASIFLLARGQAYLLVNNAFMLFLTLGTSLAFKTQEHFEAGAIAILIAAIYTGGLLLIAKAISSRSRKAQTIEPTTI